MSSFVYRFRRSLQAILKTRPLLVIGASIASSPKNGDAIINDAGKQSVNSTSQAFSFSKGLAVMSLPWSEGRTVRPAADRSGSSAEVDDAIQLHRPLEAFLAQGKEEATRIGEGYQRLEQILEALETQN
jgi:flagellum-specific ATP synthase